MTERVDESTVQRLIAVIAAGGNESFEMHVKAGMRAEFDHDDATIDFTDGEYREAVRRAGQMTTQQLREVVANGASQTGRRPNLRLVRDDE